jgi:hypothetical protein
MIIAEINDDGTVVGFVRGFLIVAAMERNFGDDSVRKVIGNFN